jgi:hypothetical protein
MRIRQLQPTERKTRTQNFTWLLIGIYRSHSVHLNRIAGKIPGKVRSVSYTQRMSRLLNNPAIDVRQWYEPVARSWLEKQAINLHQIQLIVDGTKVVLLINDNNQYSLSKTCYSNRMDVG